MSIAVDIDDLPAAIEQQIGWCYLLTVADDGQARVLAVSPKWAVGGVLQVELHGRTASNVTTRPNVTLVYPPADPHAMSLIVDGTAVIDGTTMSFEPATAVMHRPANV
ncbi:MAG: pyridoxamine 5'-phosphate oxidase family protein [Ilumatobacteraceae bacterium]